jgi:nicotinamide riboside kinase
MYKIAIIGPESSGKTTLAKIIEKNYDALYVKEYARTYLSKLKNPSNYSLQDLNNIAVEQFNAYKKAEETKPQLLVCDTEILTIKIWSEDKFNRSTKLIEDLLYKQNFDLYLLCKPDIPWEADPLREDEHRRDIIYKLYNNYCNENNLHFIIVQGNTTTRVKIIDEILKLLNFN